ncbi:MAG: sulfatase [Polyangiaceae bacterium]|nr:sulfatase [Polyangiaceae bacterium]MCE7890802.1 choline-sulfatase [Sorangiineae bacterium PRO1]MCL4749012.1 sulfatase [Myxococcales bacterium]
MPRELNILLITIDALRADMPWLGYPRAIAPNLTRFAEKAVVYTHASALSSYTSMSLGGLMSARYPSELPRSGLATSAFGPEALMLAEVLKAGGLKTLAVHGHVYFQGDTGMSQGFDDWRVVPKITTLPAREGHIVDDKLADMLIEGLKEHGSGRFFAWVHFMDPHFAYARHEGQPRFTGSAYGDAGSVVPPGTPLGEVGQSLRNLYDGEVLFTDAQVGRVLDFVERQPWADKTAVVISADHGEAFGEHKSTFEHGYTLWEVLTRVPLLIRVPGLPPARIDTRRSHIDLGRTLCELAGVPAPESFRGVSLVPELGGARPPVRDIVIDMPYTDQAPRRRALITGGKKIVVTETEQVPQVFDLDADPAEQNDLGRQKLADELRAKWTEVDRALPDFPAPRRGKRRY